MTGCHTERSCHVEVRIGVQQAKEIEVETAEGTDRDKLVADIEAVLADDTRVLWLTDKRGRTVGVPAAKVAYIEIDPAADERRVGFGPM